MDSEEKDLKEKKALLIIAFRDFRDEEYFIPKNILEKNGIKTITTSSSLGKAIGKLGGEANVDILFDKVNVSDFDAVLFVGGPGAYKLFDNIFLLKIAQEAVKKNKILGAICIAPVILAKAGVLKGKKATVWNSPMDKSAIKILEKEGAIFDKNSVVVDGKIITASGPQYAKEFGEKIINFLKQNA
ncbi:MAG TPA: DJ-1/PfpI family protein [Candidatus Pacearchaeota archaeon]|nr:DJ-1/PfpI family protein [Candidatus Pacearchaeota archaeon]